MVDVTPRDGLQNAAKPVSAKEKITLIEKLVNAGIREIQATSFVHPRWVPQLANAEQMAAELHRFCAYTVSRTYSRTSKDTTAP